MVYSAMQAAQTVVGLSPEPPPMLADMFAGTWIKKAQLTHTRGESEDHTSEKACKKGSTLALKPRADVTRGPKQGISGPTKRTYVLQKLNKEASIQLHAELFFFVVEE